MVVDRALIDTNLLLAATVEDRADHEQARSVLEWPATGTTLYISGQIAREYLSVATRPRMVNGLGLPTSAAVANIGSYLSRMQLLSEGAPVVARLLSLVDEVPCAGKQIHDANIVATMLVHGVDTLVTANVADFARFEDHVRVLPLVEP